MSNEKYKDGLKRFSQETFEQIRTAYLDTENPHREIKLKTAVPSLSKVDPVLADAIRRFLRIREIEFLLHDCLLNPRSTLDQDIRDLSNERVDIEAEISVSSDLARNYELVEAKFKPKFAKKAKPKAKF